PVVPPSPGTPLTAPLAPAVSPPAATATTENANQRWMRAQQAERAGNVAEAIQIYTQLGNDEVNRNHDLAMQAYNHAQCLARQYPGVMATIPQPGRPTEARYPNPSAGVPAIKPVPPPGTVVPGAAGLVSSGPGLLQRRAQRVDDRD